MNTTKTSLLLLISIFAAPLLFAQDIEKELRKPAEQVSAQQAAGQLAAEAAGQAVSTAAASVQQSTVAAEIPLSAAVSTAPAKAAAPADITYAQILERPDDIDLNFEYAKQQVRRGDLKGAAGTLERVLMVNPDLHAMRLFYGVVLFRLDNLSESRRELEAVKQGKASPPLKAEASSYLAELKKRQQLTTVSASLSAGAEYDSNRNASPTSQKRLFLGSPLQLTGDSRRKDDASFLLMGSAELRRALDPQRKKEAFASASYFRADQNNVKSVNLMAQSLKAGGTLRAGRNEFTPVLSYDRVFLQNEKFLLNSGVSLRADRRHSRVLNFWAQAGYAYQDNLATPKVGSNPQRRGPLYTLSAGAGRVLNPVMKLDADLAYSAKQADKRYNSYSSSVLTLRHSWLLGKGRFLLTSAAAGNDIYRQADTAISARTRKDTTLRFGAVYGLPLSQLHRRLAKLEALTLTLSAEHFSSKSTLTNYTYENNKAALLVSYRWDAGF